MITQHTKLSSSLTVEVIFVHVAGHLRRPTDWLLEKGFQELLDLDATMRGGYYKTKDGNAVQRPYIRSVANCPPAEVVHAADDRLENHSKSKPQFLMTTAGIYYVNAKIMTDVAVTEARVRQKEAALEGSNSVCLTPQRSGESFENYMPRCINIFHCTYGGLHKVQLVVVDAEEGKVELRCDCKVGACGIFIRLSVPALFQFNSGLLASVHTLVSACPFTVCTSMLYCFTPFATCLVLSLSHAPSIAPFSSILSPPLLSLPSFLQSFYLVSRWRFLWGRDTHPYPPTQKHT
jgi:hypothetical protein